IRATRADFECHDCFHRPVIADDRSAVSQRAAVAGHVSGRRVRAADQRADDCRHVAFGHPPGVARPTYPLRALTALATTEVLEPRTEPSLEDEIVDARLTVTSQWQLIWGRFLKHRVAVVSLGILVVFYLLALFAD